jgi:hypothetical protein
MIDTPAPPFEQLTEDQKATLCNGCGGKGGTVPVPQFMFHASCDRHDYHYWIGCTEADRHAANLDFYARLIRDADRSADDKFWLWRWAVRASLHDAARIYYEAVEYFGKRYFHYADKKRTMADVLALTARTDLSQPRSVCGRIASPTSVPLPEGQCGESLSFGVRGQVLDHDPLS